MLAQFYLPRSMSPSRMDRYLAGGWFRSCSVFYRAKLICMDERVYSVVNLRLPLTDYRFPKRLRKLYNRNNRRFRVEFGDLQITKRKDALYQLQKSRFQGFTSNTLYEFFFVSDDFRDVFRTREVRVYDPETDKLVAVSFFDEGQQSLASLLAVYDPAYGRHSLGTYTMLLEVAYGQHHHKKFFYPGYTLDMPSSFDYKLRLKNLQFFTRKRRWANLERLDEELTFGQELRQNVARLEEVLRAEAIPYERKIYPVFVLAYWEQLIHEQFLDAPIFLVLNQDDQHLLLATYNLENKEYQLVWTEIVEDYTLEEMNPSPEYLNSAVYFDRVLSYDHIALRTRLPQEIVAALRHLS